MIEHRLSFLLNGKYWSLKCLTLSFLAVLIFSSSPAIFSSNIVKLPPAYELKSRQPFVDTARLTIPVEEGMRSHGAKLSPRLVGSLSLYVANKLSLHPYLPATIGGLVFLLSGILVGTQLTGDRVVGCTIGLTFAGLYASSACFAINLDPKPFDGVALGLLGLTMISITRYMNRPPLVGFYSFLCCWTDERALVSLFLFAGIIFFNRDWSNKQKVMGYAILIGTAILYSVTRFFAAQYFGWGLDVSSLGIEIFKGGLLYLPLVGWIAFEGGWLIIFFGLYILFIKKKSACLLLLLIAGILSMASTIMVMDISRATTFIFPLIIVSLSVLVRYNVPLDQIRLVSACSATISLIAPNLELITLEIFAWNPSLLMKYIQSSLGYSRILGIPW